MFALFKPISTDSSAHSFHPKATYRFIFVIQDIYIAIIVQITLQGSV